MLRLGVLSLAILAIGAVGPRECVAPNTDLQIAAVSGTGVTAYCCEGNTAVCFLVRNVGTGFARASTATVTFDFPGAPLPVSMPVGPIGPGGTSAVISVPIPAGCFNVDCDFHIEVDSGGVVTESSETNNTVTGRCIG